MASLPEDLKIVLVGHRGVGKRDLGRRVASRMELELLDIERQMEGSDIEAAEVDERGRVVTRDFASSEERGFQYRQGMLVEGLRRPGRRLIVVPPGCCVAGAEAEDGARLPWVFWVQASGWRYEARRREGEPTRHKTWSLEFEWRRQTRRPRWESRADFVFRMPWGRLPERSAALMESRVNVLSEARRPAGSIRAWSVPGDREQLRRAVRDARHLGGGVKIRQWTFSEFPSLREVTGGDGDRDGGGSHLPRVMASVGGGPMAWAVQPGVTDLEVGAERAAALSERELIREMASLERVWVTGRTQGVDAEAVERLESITASVATSLEGTSIRVAPRWKPRIGAWEQVREVLEQMGAMRTRWPTADVSPVGARWVGLSPWFATRNPGFELSVGLAEWRRSFTSTSEEPAVDLQTMLPTLAGEPPERFDAIVGAEVTRHRATEWHRVAALRSKERFGALACDTIGDPDEASLEALFDVLRTMGVRGVSVDSPMRRRVLALPNVWNSEKLPAANVLTRRSRGWIARDTDHVGMAAVLTEASRRGVEAGAVALIGRDDRAPAIRRAIEAAMEWRLVYHADESGWGWDAPSHVALVVNLAGPVEGVYERPPACELWVDLHEEVAPPPPVADDHICGDCYFEAQALAARDLWGRDAEG